MKKLLADNCWEDIKNRFELKESNNNMKINITDLPDDGLKISMPSGIHIKIVEKEYHHSCDYLILIPCENCMDVYFIELKKTIRPNKDDIPERACNQILYTTPYWDYLVSMMKTGFYEKIRDIESFKIRKHFVVIAEKEKSKTDKQKTRSEWISDREYKKQNFKVIHSLRKIPLKHLRCRNPS